MQGWSQKNLWEGVSQKKFSFLEFFYLKKLFLLFFKLKEKYKKALQTTSRLQFSPPNYQNATKRPPIFFYIPILPLFF